MHTYKCIYSHMKCSLLLLYLLEIYNRATNLAGEHNIQLKTIKKARGKSNVSDCISEILEFAIGGCERKRSSSFYSIVMG